MPFERTLFPHSEDDATILSSLQRGDINALSKLYRKYVQDLYNYGRHVIRDEEQVEDAIQDTFLEIWKMKERMGQVSNIKFYLFTILRRLLLKNISLKQPSPDEFSDFSGSREDELILEELKIGQNEILRISINSLPERQREIIFLRFYEGLELSQIAEILHITMPSLYNLLHRALTSLRSEIKKYHPDFYS